MAVDMAKSKSKTTKSDARPNTRPVNRLAVYTGSFDPMTLGHLDIIGRASRLFDELIVAIGEARGKVPLFPASERLELIAAACKSLPNVRTETFSGLAVEFAKKVRAIAMIRGLRSTSDYDYEMQMALMNRALATEVETIFIPTSPQFSHISSSLAKEIALHHGHVDLLVPPPVARALKAKIREK